MSLRFEDFAEYHLLLFTAFVSDAYAENLSLQDTFDLLTVSVKIKFPATQFTFFQHREEELESRTYGHFILFSLLKLQTSINFLLRKRIEEKWEIILL